MNMLRSLSGPKFIRQTDVEHRCRTLNNNMLRSLSGPKFIQKTGIAHQC